MIRFLVCLALMPILVACTGVRDFPAPPIDDYEKAVVPGYDSSIRFWGDQRPPGIDNELALIQSQIIARANAEGKLPNDGLIDVLVLSGGGSDGAFGAGLLNGWTAKGDRPEFTLVTGISTGALIAPFAFLGSEYDPELERFYTNTKTDDVVALRIFSTLTGSLLGLSDTTGLKAAVERGITNDVVRRIAAEHAKGRRLWVGSTNLDAQRPVIWDLGRIAQSSDPNRRALIRDILLASAAIPGAFPPRQIRVQIDGETYTEMHVDGGVTRQLFLYPVELDLSTVEQDERLRLRQGTVFAVRNTKLDPDFAPTAASIVDIAARSISTLIKAAGVADVLVIIAQTQRDGFDLKFTSVPADFTQREDELFDPVYMRALYDRGYDLITNGDPWREATPPPT